MSDYKYNDADWENILNFWKQHGRRGMKTALRNFAKGKPCQVRLACCDGGGETSVWAHASGVSLGHGVSFKVHDILGAIACFACHDEIDRRTRHFDADFVALAFWQGHARSLLLAIDAGLVSVAIPPTKHYELTEVDVSYLDT